MEGTLVDALDDFTVGALLGCLSVAAGSLVVTAAGAGEEPSFGDRLDKPVGSTLCPAFGEDVVVAIGLDVGPPGEEPDDSNEGLPDGVIVWLFVGSAVSEPVGDSLGEFVSISEGREDAVLKFPDSPTPPSGSEVEVGVGFDSFCIEDGLGVGADPPSPPNSPTSPPISGDPAPSFSPSCVDDGLGVCLDPSLPPDSPTSPSILFGAELGEGFDPKFTFSST